MKVGGVRARWRRELDPGRRATLSTCAGSVVGLAAAAVLIGASVFLTDGSSEKEEDDGIVSVNGEVLDEPYAAR